MNRDRFLPPDQLAEQYVQRLSLLEGLRDGLQRETVEALSGVAHVARVSFRVKTVQSFVTKAQDPNNSPGYSDPLVEIEDQVAGRVLVFFLSDLAVVRQRIEGTFNTVERVERRPHRDAEFGYESDHLVCLIPPHVKPSQWDTRSDLPTTFELQIRTLFMHAYAEPQHDLAYKTSKELPLPFRRKPKSSDGDEPHVFATDRECALDERLRIEDDPDLELREAGITELDFGD